MTQLKDASIDNGRYIVHKVNLLSVTARILLKFTVLYNHNWRVSGLHHQQSATSWVSVEGMG